MLALATKPLTAPLPLALERIRDAVAARIGGVRFGMDGFVARSPSDDEGRPSRRKSTISRTRPGDPRVTPSNFRRCRGTRGLIRRGALATFRRRCDRTPREGTPPSLERCNVPMGRSNAGAARMRDRNRVYVGIKITSQEWPLCAKQRL